MPHVRPLEGKLWEMRMKGRDGIGRAIDVGRSGQRLIVLHIFAKKTRERGLVLRERGLARTGSGLAFCPHCVGDRVGFFDTHGALQRSMGRVPGKGHLTPRRWPAMDGGNISGGNGPGVRHIRGRKGGRARSCSVRRF